MLEKEFSMDINTLYRRQKVFNRGLHVRARGLDILKIDYISTDLK